MSSTDQPGPGPAQLDLPEERLLNRELSWLDFTTRVLAQAADEAVPLLERVRFCSIVASTLDEFFMVRVAGLERQVAAGLAVRSADGRTPAAVLHDIRDRVLALCERQALLWQSGLRPALAEAGIDIADLDGCEPDDLRALEVWFDRNVYPVLTPLAVGPGQPFP
jgi:polyphosphate kinase